MTSKISFVNKIEFKLQDEMFAEFTWHMENAH